MDLPCKYDYKTGMVYVSQKTHFKALLHGGPVCCPSCDGVGYFEDHPGCCNNPPPGYPQDECCGYLEPNVLTCDLCNGHGSIPYQQLIDLKLLTIEDEEHEHAN